MKKIFNFKRPKSIAAQISSLKKHFPNFYVSFSGHNSLKVSGEICPTSRSEVYSFELEYVLKSKPVIKILNPVLIKNFKGDKIPHIYSDDSLCLYRPKYGEFTSSDLLSETIIPWTVLWLYYYEVWHMTGEWLGGGEHFETK